MYVQKSTPGWRPNFSGLGDSTLDLTGYTDQSTITGLPVYAEIGLGILGFLALIQLTKVGRKATRYTRKRAATRSQRAALRAQLAAL